MITETPHGALLDEVFRTTPLPFIKEFLREHRSRSKGVRIGQTIKEVRRNLHDALLAATIGEDELRTWLRGVEGWGRQHLYLATVPSRSLSGAPLLSDSALARFLRRKGISIDPNLSGAPTTSSSLTAIVVDDELARLTWRAYSTTFERREELDEYRELDDGDYEFRAYRRAPRLYVSHLIIRKIDGVIIRLIDLPLGDEHSDLDRDILQIASLIIAPVSPTAVPLAKVVTALDQDAIRSFGPRPHRGLSMGVAPTQTRFRADGAHVEFRSTAQSSGYAESSAVRHVRNALRIEKFVGELGKFRLTFRSQQQKEHTMVVSFDAVGNRAYLFSRMTENEVMGLVDQLIRLA